MAASLSSQLDIEVRYAETDQMGVVYYANYYVWFEVGRTGLMKDYGFNYRDLEEQGYFLPVIESHANYFQSAKYGATVNLETRVNREGRSKLRFEYICFDEQGEKLVTGHTVHIFMNHHGRPVKLPNGLAELFEKSDEN